MRRWSCIGMISACYINAAGAFFAFPSAKPRALSIMDGAKDDPLFDVRYDDSGSVDLHMIRAGKINDFVANPDKLNFADLNDIFGPYEKRQRDILRTLETASCIFRLDGVLVDTLDLHEKVWKKIAEIQSLPVPTTKQVMQSLHMAPIVALNKVFEWDVEGQQALEISLKHSLLVADTFREAELEALPGAKNLLLELTGNEIPAAVISNIPPEVVEDVLEKADLLNHVKCVEGYDGKLKREAQLLLNACLEMERPPKHAVFFDFSAQGCIEAHENDIKAVATSGLYEMEDLHIADAKILELDDWTLQRYRHLLEQFPFDEQYEVETAATAEGWRPNWMTKTKTVDAWRYEKLPNGQLIPTETGGQGGKSGGKDGGRKNRDTL